MIRPTFDRILIKPIKESLSDILIIPDKEVSQSDSCQGEVMAVGPGRDVKGKRMPLDVRVGEIVRFKFHETYPVYTVDDVRYLIISEPDVEGIVESA